MTAVKIEYHDSVAVFTVDNPPVNAIGQNVRQGLMDAITQIEQADQIKSAVIICDGRTFMAGADIKEFGKPPVEPHLPTVVDAIEQCSKSIVAAIHGQALGGGLEIALGCHYRIAVPTAKVGLPEVLLGLIPGAGGTQRLPRLIGAEAALDMISSGKAIAASKALKLGVVDSISENDLREDAIALAKSVIGNDLASRRISLMTVAPVPADFFETKRAELRKRRRGFEAPQACVNAVEAAATLDFEAGTVAERKLFMECKASPQSDAQRHMFFAERTSLKVDDLDKAIKGRDIKTVAIIGAGTMGGGIAICFADAGYNVTLLEINPDALKAGLERIDKTYAANVSKGRMSDDAKQERLALITGTTNYDDLSTADMVIEAAFEKMDVKKSIYGELDRVCKDDCILATNTSYLDVNEIAAIVSKPENVLGLHFFSPANIMKLLEIVRADKTADDVLKTALEVTKRIGKIGVVSGVCHGFIGNRIWQHYQREAGLLLLEGATPAQIDKAMTDFGLPMGPCAVGDLAGLDIGYLMRQSLFEDQYEAKAFRVHSKLVEMDRKGQKTKSGFYDYPEGARKGVESTLVEGIILDTASELNITRRDITNDEIVERCVYAMINAGAAILEEGIAARASDIDVVMCNGYGFPRWRGGPMHYGETVGYNKIVKRINEFSDSSGPRWWTPPQWLTDKT